MGKVTKGIQTHETVTNQRAALGGGGDFRHIVQQDFKASFLGCCVKPVSVINKKQIKMGLMERADNKSEY